MAVAGWILDKSAAARARDAGVGPQLAELAGSLAVCPVGQLEQLYSARSPEDYDALAQELRASFDIVAAPGDVLDRALHLQRDLAHHHGMWHRTTDSGSAHRMHGPAPRSGCGARGRRL